ncbi:hypothetical protein WNZ15_02560 [Roseibium sp. AS2]|uniref:hypothetical protein n=1 Tax=Roseibium sp. AS2 TaxID=3135781 RepID=UPI003178F3B3
MRKTAACLLLLPFLLLALLPRGYMPTVQEDGVFTVTLCTSSGLKTLALDAAGNEVPASPAGDDDGAERPCIFAGLTTLALYQGTPDLPAANAGNSAAIGFASPGPFGSVRTGRLGARAPPLGT